MGVRTMIKESMRRLGLDVMRWTPRTACERQSAYAVSYLLGGAPVRTVFDVGANVGQSADLYLGLFPEAQVYSFEPFPEACRRLRERFAGHPRVRVEQLALSDSVGVATFRSNEYDETNSLLPTADGGSEEAGVARIMRTRGTIDVPTSTVDAFCDDRKIDAIDLLKIDVQGAAGMVLSGAARTLGEKRVRAVYVEVEFFELYKGQERFPEIAARLEAAGYVLYRLYNLTNPKGRLAWCDALFVRPDLLERHAALP